MFDTCDAYHNLLQNPFCWSDPHGNNKWKGIYGQSGECREPPTLWSGESALDGRPRIIGTNSTWFWSLYRVTCANCGVPVDGACSWHTAPQVLDPTISCSLARFCHKLRQSIHEVLIQTNLGLCRHTRGKLILMHCVGGQWPPTGTKNHEQNLIDLDFSRLILKCLEISWFVLFYLEISWCVMKSLETHNRELL
jgi:hypothetical protein